MRKSKNLLSYGSLVSLCITLVACGGGSGGESETGAGGGDVVTFGGGTIDDLRALNGALTFGTLSITGPLQLPIAGNEKLTVGDLTVTAGGSIGYEYSTCEYRDAPSLTIEASGDVDLGGDVLLKGRSGTSVTSGATCNSCYGRDGGNLNIESGGDIVITARVRNGGGGGASIRSPGFPSSPCSAGDSGNLTLSADGSISLDGAEIDNDAGRNFDNDYGVSGTATLSAANEFKMIGGSMRTTGTLSLTASMADIHGPVYYGTLNEVLGTVSDVTPPVALLLAPQDNAPLPFNQPFEIRVQAYDEDMGVRDVHVAGFGIDQRYLESEFINGVLTIGVDTAQMPTDLTVTVTDNAALETVVNAFGLTIVYQQEAEPNETLANAQSVAQGDLIQGDIRTGDTGQVYAVVQSFLQTAGDVNWATRLVEDTYALPIGPGQSALNIALDFPGNIGSDIDIYLLNDMGTIVAQSTNDNPGTGNYRETIFYGSVSEGEIYHLVLQAFAVATRADYEISR